MRKLCASMALFAVLAAGAGTTYANPPVQGASAIPFKHESNSASGAMAGGAIGVLALSLAAIAAVLMVRKRLNLSARGMGAPTLLRVLETQRLGPRALLSVVEFGGARYMLAQSEHGITCLASAPIPECP